MGGRHIVAVPAVAACVLLGCTATALASAWRVALHPGGDVTSFEALTASPGGPVWAVGGRSTPDGYDAPTAWRRTGSVWTPMAIPVDLTGRWGYLQAVAASGAGDVWAVGHTTIESNGDSQPLVAHGNGSSWTVVSQPWLAPGATGQFSVVVARSPADVWVGGTVAQGVSTPVLWHFNGFVWTQSIPPVMNGHCQTNAPAVVASAVATGDGLYLALDCQTPRFSFAGLAERFDGRHWHSVMRLPDGIEVTALTADSAGTVWATGFSTVLQTTAQVWTGGPSGMTWVAIPAPAGSTG